MKSRLLLSLGSIPEAFTTIQNSLKIMPEEERLWGELLDYLKSEVEKDEVQKKLEVE